MTLAKVRQYLKRYGADGRIKEFDVSSATVELAAQALKCEPQRIAKTLAFKTGDGAVLIVCAGDVRVDNKKYREIFNAKAKMLSPDEVKDVVGFEIGGVCPFGVNDGVKVYLDRSLQRFATVFPACGSANSAIELTIDELAEYSRFAAWVDVCKCG